MRTDEEGVVEVRVGSDSGHLTGPVCLPRLLHMAFGKSKSQLPKHQKWSFRPADSPCLLLFSNAILRQRSFSSDGLDQESWVFVPKSRSLELRRSGPSPPNITNAEIELKNTA